MNPAQNIISGRTLTVGIAEMSVSDDSGATIVTHALGSCIALVLWDPLRGVGGLLHYLLPSARGARPGERPDTAFADTGVPLLFEAMYRKGCKREDVKTFAVGGASMGPTPNSDVFDIGARNIAALRKILFRNSVLIQAEDTGGHVSRTVSIALANGRVVVRTPQSERVLSQEAPPSPRLVRLESATTHSVGSAEMKVVSDPSSTINSGPIGSSVGVVLWDPIVRVGGMLVFQLPSAKGARPGERPSAAFADSGVPDLFEAMYTKGARKDTIQVTVVGGATMSNNTAADVFDVGARNVTALRKILFRNSVLIRAEDVGGTLSRTVSLDVGLGRVVVRSATGERTL